MAPQNLNGTKSDEVFTTYNLEFQIKLSPWLLGAIMIAMVFTVLVLHNSTTPLELQVVHLKLVVQLIDIFPSRRNYLTAASLFQK